eukprot:TRINITY_DN4689_c0_g1_i7.p1 TRINITY_DN4689_c0_g1~~TRINITY_DN4689_c0_g1_i7.p1  ORF type:complete len:675 (+),score=92.54 TRINITY_DN4689_c0_g1_i7:517-2541(+)
MTSSTSQSKKYVSNEPYPVDYHVADISGYRNINFQKLNYPFDHYDEILGINSKGVVVYANHSRTQTATGYETRMIVVDGTTVINEAIQGDNFVYSSFMVDDNILKASSGVFDISLPNIPLLVDVHGISSDNIVFGTTAMYVGGRPVLRTDMSNASNPVSMPTTMLDDNFDREHVGTNGEYIFALNKSSILKVHTFNNPTPAPDTLVPTGIPDTDVPATNVPTDIPSTNAPDTDVPATDAPSTKAPETDVPVTNVPTTDIPSTTAPDTDAPATNSPATKVPATGVPATSAPATDAPTTDTPPTKGPETFAPPLLSEEKKSAKEATSGGVAVGSLVVQSASSGLGLGIAPVHMARNNIIGSLLQCDDGIEELDFTQHPLRFSIGDDEYAQIRGSVLGNVSIFVVFGIGCVVAAKRGIWFPIGVWMVLLQFLWGSIVQGAFSLLFYSSDEGIGIGVPVLAVVFILSSLTLIAFASFTARRCAKMERVTPAPTGLRRFFYPRKEWVDAGWRASFFDGYKQNHCMYCFVQMLSMMTLSILSAWVPASPLQCSSRAGIICCMPIFWLALILKDRPYLRMIENAFEFVVTGFEIMMLVTNFVFLLNEESTDLVANIGFALNIIITARFVFDLLLMLFDKCTKQKETFTDTEPIDDFPDIEKDVSPRVVYQLIPFDGCSYHL